MKTFGKVAFLVVNCTFSINIDQNRMELVGKYCLDFRQ